MALSDYYLCDVCNGKCFYDANLNWVEDPNDPGILVIEKVGDMAVICSDCAKTHETVVIKRHTNQQEQTE